MPKLSIAGRSKERSELLEIYQSRKAEFVVVYGRRRIGKTFLIEELFKTKNGYFFHVTGVQDGALTEQLGEFAKAIGRTFYQGASIATSGSWMQAFEELSKAINATQQSKKIVLFFDELPWMATKKSRLLQALDYYWNRYWKNDSRIKLVICGSSASWMIRKIIYSKGGLHNRQTKTIILKPFNLSETKEFFLKKHHIQFTHKQLIELYMFCGGVPFYLTHVKRGKSITQLINQMCFQPDGILFDEFDKLFNSLFEQAAVYKELIYIIAEKREGVDRAYIEKRSQYLSKGGTLTERLRDLEDAGFIKAFMPLGHKRQGLYYRVIDEYCLFYLKWIRPAKTGLSLQENQNLYWSSKRGTPEYYHWRGYAFEATCYKHLGEIRKALGIEAGAMIGSWRYAPRQALQQGAQIDLLFDRPDGICTVCEIKYTDELFAIDKQYFEVLNKKMEIYKQQTRTQKKIELAFISAAGVKNNKYYQQLVEHVIELDEFFKIA